MAINYGKLFELKFSEDFLKIPGANLLRLYDLVSGYKLVSRNPCDFIGYIYPYEFMIECKSTEGNTFNFGKLRLYDLLLNYTDKKGVIPGVIIWFIDHDKVCFVTIDEIKRLKLNNYKSINVKMIDNIDYKVFSIPSIKKRIFLLSDYTKLLLIANLIFGGNY